MSDGTKSNLVQEDESHLLNGEIPEMLHQRNPNEFCQPLQCNWPFGMCIIRDCVVVNNFSSIVLLNSHGRFQFPDHASSDKTNNLQFMEQCLQEEMISYRLKRREFPPRVLDENICRRFTDVTALLKSPKFSESKFINIGDVLFSDPSESCDVDEGSLLHCYETLDETLQLVSSNSSSSVYEEVIETSQLVGDDAAFEDLLLAEADQLESLVNPGGIKERQQVGDGTAEDGCVTLSCPSGYGTLSCPSGYGALSCPSGYGTLSCPSGYGTLSCASGYNSKSNADRLESLVNPGGIKERQQVADGTGGMKERQQVGDGTAEDGCGTLSCPSGYGTLSCPSGYGTLSCPSGYNSESNADSAVSVSPTSSCECSSTSSSQTVASSDEVVKVLTAEFSPKRRADLRVGKGKRKANMRERKRIKDLSVAFTDLRRCIPKFKYHCKQISQLEILRESVNYIQQLLALLDGSIPSRPATGGFTGSVRSRLFRCLANSKVISSEPVAYAKDDHNARGSEELISDSLVPMEAGEQLMLPMNVSHDDDDDDVVVGSGSRPISPASFDCSSVGLYDDLSVWFPAYGFFFAGDMADEVPAFDCGY